ncbi:hypothetical protein KVR01_012135 [Diaporthe batatas]|uniref:uncharacterized protein n=1 Tax=Diaporthe batatas TaxID=748121 RepID=UPI001D045455|nr:uncharacterized protein KVR01_012135 [Diaporthe batatas]KAG8157863.1 hypothetical protein KVR01_012135 [Diaporthe batatas]
MAIEAAKQVADPSRQISGYRVQDAVFLAPIPVEEDRSEVQLHMRPDHAHPVDKSTTSFEFRVYSMSNSGWFENCHGFVQVVYENDRNGDQDVRHRENSFFRKRFDEARKQCVHPVPKKQMYENFISNGLMYGPSFQGMDNLYWDGGDIAVGDVRCFRWTEEQSQNARQAHVAHPTTLDAAGQLSWVVLTEGATKTLVNGFAATRIGSMWLANSGFSYPETDHIRVWTKSVFKGLRGTDCSLFALNESGELVMEISHFETTTVGGSDTATEAEPPREICYDMVYRPDVSLMDTKQLSWATTLDATVHDDMELRAARFYQDLESTLFYLAKKTRDATRSLESSQISMEPHIARYVSWLDRQVSRYEDGDLKDRGQSWAHNINDSSDMDALMDDLEATNNKGQLFMRVGRELVNIVHGVQDPLALIFESGLAERYYQEQCDEMLCSKQLSKYLALLSHKNPHMSVLEVGAGTGSMTNCVIEGLGRRFGQYVYTDISEACFEAAKARFSTFESKVAFRLLDFERDAVEQGYEAESYDLVVAAWALHTTRDLASTIQHVRRLLKPHGKLILVEFTEPEILRNSFIFGTLPGWWAGLEPDRQWGPCVPVPRWSELLLANGFESVDLVLHDHSEHISRETDIIVATRDGSECLPDAAPRRGPVTLLLGRDHQPQTAVAEGLRRTLEKQGGVSCQIETHIDKPLAPNSTLVFLAELYELYLSALDEESFGRLKDLLGTAKVVIWLSHSCRSSASFPDTEMVKGLARVLSTENPSLRFVTLKFESSPLEVDTCVRLATEVITTVLRDASSETCELEYVEREGALMINRVYPSDQLNREVHTKTRTLLTDRKIEESPPLALKVPNPGLLDSLRWEADSLGARPENIGDDELEIEVQAIGVNFRDLLVVLGKFNASTVGCECAGVVTRVGARSATRFQPGDRVCAGVLGCARTLVRCHMDLAVKVPPYLSVEEAAALPITGVTAYYSLVTLANLQKEDSILIHSATGGTGQMALQLAQSIGAQVFVTVGTEEKRKLVRDSFGVPEENILYSRDTSFAKELLRRTDGRGVDVVLNSLAGGALLASWECVAPFGRFIELGKADIQANSNLPMSRFFGEISFHAVAVDYIAENRPALFQKQLQAVMKLLDDKVLKVASPSNLYSVTQIESAFRNMQSGKNTGKMVLTLRPSDVVPTWLPPSYSCHLDPTVSYLIAGGLGGLGRSTARWMAQRGARHLILLSRSGPKSKTAQELVKELEQAGVTVRTPQCDVSNSSALIAALDQCKDMPPIKGCLQATMVLQDTLFEKMTWDQWSKSIQSKVPSTWNLHSHLPRDLDFFIMLSSAAGIVGSMGQSNYAAGNTYQDGLAAHRLALGEAALSIDLGWMGDVGIVAENEELARGKGAIADLAPVFEAEFLALLDRYCDRDIPQPPELSQLVIGLVTPAQFKRKGAEPPDWLVERPIFKGLPRDSNGDGNDGAPAGSGRSDRNWAEELGRAASATEAAAVVVEALRRKLAKATSIPQDEIDTKQPLHVYGVDSLLAVEIRNWFAKTLKTDVAIFDITGQGSLEEVAERAAAQSSLVTNIEGVL